MEKIKIKMSDIGLYLRIIHMDYNPSTKEELSALVEEHFNVLCTPEDIELYEQLHKEAEDYEKLSRMIEFGNNEYLIE